MPTEQYLELAAVDQKEVLATAAQASGRDENTLEKDVWVVWALSVLFENEIGQHLSFKGGTSLSKAYRAIDRFSEDIDLTYDIRSIIPEMAGHGDGLPPSRSQSQKWTEKVRERLPQWIADTVSPLLQASIKEQGLTATLKQETKERLFIDYRPGLFDEGGYVRSEIMLEFGARSTGEPTEVHEVACDAAAYVPEVAFPVARPRVMKVERTFWEKATAAHVYCAQEQLKGERFARHWHDLAALAQTEFLNSALQDKEVAATVANHKAMFFREKALDGTVVDYKAAVTGSLRLVPNGDARLALEKDYAAMTTAGMFYSEPRPFSEILAVCSEIEARANANST
ncbi:nucleotidyl transferase AbiEii/AbiGii toxin family protein [Pelagibius litoralis]|uniref:Nucleotidyl transferase AbiEii/AbiGii toxin family protein n=1 Tax=Pelagibius litoralis TaxID=374515 RepID=A0A967K9E8_9PROT|nr:nucleotidyl transferase AbiEii/AbiGii toxin family protein [Pelagibius litoralis]NIA70993.1 nucleotidyl transferase AbiEii/AbiGii toxin family protein [Pelagibius litoralis]